MSFPNGGIDDDEVGLVVEQLQQPEPDCGMVVDYEQAKPRKVEVRQPEQKEELAS